VIVDRTEWGRLRVTGGDRVRFLQGLTTVNVEQLGDGAHGWGAILNPKGRVLSVIDIARLGDAFMISCEAALAAPTRTILDRYAVMDDVVFEPITGPAHQAWTDVASVWTAPIVEGAGANPIADTDPAVERLRIRAGFLRYGADVDDDHFPFETPLAKFLDYGKGCYVGQEPVFRVHAQGNAARALRGFTIEGDAPIAAGTTIDHAAKANAGKITSSISDVGHDGQSIIALGYLHRTAWDAGGTVTIAGRTAAVFELPMEPR
jgi:folate-binding protein YgfZ